MRSLFDPSPTILTAPDLVHALTGRRAHELALPSRAIVTFNTGDLKTLIMGANAKPIDAWSRLRPVYRIHNTDAVVTRSYFGGPNVGALVEELSAFGVREFILWGYCGAISENVAVGDVLVAKGALREEGVSYHYLPADDDFVYSGWYADWEDSTKEAGIREALVWSCDALYRETAAKILKYRQMGISGVEMEVASLYAVCAYKRLKSIAFLVVSDSFTNGTWHGGFSTDLFKQGARKLSTFISEKCAACRD